MKGVREGDSPRPGHPLKAGKVQRLLGMAAILGLGCVGGGMLLLMGKAFPSLAGEPRLAAAVALLALGFLLLVPVKVYIVLRLTRPRSRLSSAASLSRPGHDANAGKDHGQA